MRSDELEAIRERAQGESIDQEDALALLAEVDRLWAGWQGAADEVQRLLPLLTDANNRALLIQGERDDLRAEVDRLQVARGEPTPPMNSKATWIWDDGGPEEFGQIYYPCCSVCSNGPLTGDDHLTGLCSECSR